MISCSKRFQNCRKFPSLVPECCNCNCRWHGVIDGCYTSCIQSGPDAPPCTMCNCTPTDTVHSLRVYVWRLLDEYCYNVDQKCDLTNTCHRSVFAGSDVATGGILINDELLPCKRVHTLTRHVLLAHSQQGAEDNRFWQSGSQWRALLEEWTACEGAVAAEVVFSVPIQSCIDIIAIGTPFLGSCLKYHHGNSQYQTHPGW